MLVRRGIISGTPRFANDNKDNVMRKFLLAATALVAVSAPAFAADLPSRVAPAPMTTTYVPVFTWTGFYIGVNAGYGWMQNDNITFTNPFGVSTSFSGGDDGGFTGGGQIGYNMQYNQFVFGLETDIQYADFGRKNYYATGFGPFPTFATDNGNYFGTVRGRLGYAIDRTLIYVTGGLAYGDVGETVGNADTEWGWTLGGGVEYAFTNNWTAKLEGLYVNLDRGNSAVTYNSIQGVSRVSGSSNTEFGVVRVGLNYKF
jgi:outer membrane immunogenic protein